MKDFIRLLRIYIIRFLANICASKLELGNRVLIIAPHPDDEVIGCSGLIQKAIAQGKDLGVCILTGGEGSHRGCCDISAEDLIKNRRTLAKNITNKLGLSPDKLFLLDFKDGGISKRSNECLKLSQLINDFAPDSIFIPHQKGEGWHDHIEAGNIVKEIIKGKSVGLYEYCVWFWYYNVWNIDWAHANILHLSDSESLAKKQSIDDYVSPLAPCGHPYSGVLPKLFVEANKWNKELYFKIK